MLTASADTIAEVIGGTVLAGSGQAMANDVVVDSRVAAPGCVFIALPGDNSDGHDHLASALASGARVLVVTRELHQLPAEVALAMRGGAVVVKVADALLALQRLAAWHRRRLHATVVGVTGSTGKTTTKDFLTGALAGSCRVVATQGNRNNEIGLPLTILRAGSDTDVLVVEMGMRGLGQIARLAEIARPDMGLVTNVGASHIELLGTQDAVATAKGELVRAVPVNGAVFLNGDDAYSDALRLDAKAPVTMYGLSERCDVRAVDVEVDEASHARFTLESPQGDIRVELPLPGRHNVYNALAAAAVAFRLAVPIECLKQGIEAANVSQMRMQLITTPDNVTIVNDAYNANPTSTRAALETLAEMRVPGRRVAVLGDMAELGSLSELAHFQIGEAVPKLSIDLLVVVGPRAARIADGAKAEGLDATRIIRCDDADEAIARLVGEIGNGDAVLVKASRVMGLERIVEGLVNPRAL